MPYRSRKFIYTSQVVPPVTAAAVAIAMYTMLIPMAHAPETGAINRLHFLAPVFGRRFFVPYTSGMKISDVENKHG